MSDTQIDSLQIKIVASANDAAAAISNVASAVGKLSDKKTQNAKNFLSTLSAELEKIKTASTAVANISALAQSLGALSGVGSLVKATNGLKNIAPAVNALQATDLAGVSEKMTALANAMVPLSGMTGLSGFSRAMSSLKGLPDIEKKLTPETLDSFAEKVKKVADAVTPLSNKLTTVAEGFQAMNVPVKEATQNTEELTKSLSTIEFSALLSVGSGIFNIAKKISNKVLELTSEVIDLDGIIERFSRGFGDSAQEAYSWIKRLNEEMGLNVQMFMQYTSIFAQMLEGLGVAQKDASKMAIGYSELAYDIWAAYNDIYEKYEDAVKAVQSAIAGQTRPLRRAGFSVLNVTLKQTAANHGLEISLQNATEAEKSYLRYLALIDQAQAQGIVGTYAKEMNTAEGQLRTLRQEMKSLTQEAGSFLLPLLTKTVPIVQAAVRLISEAIQKLAALFGVTLRTPEWGNSTGFTEAVEGAEDAAEGIESAMGGAAGSAKELKKTLLGIDEINQLNDAKKNSGGGGGGGSSGTSGIPAGYDWDVSSLWTEAIFKDINNRVDELTEKMRDLLPIVEAIGGAFAMFKLADVINKLSKALGLSNDLTKSLTTVVTVAAEGYLTYKFTSDYLQTGNITDLIAEGLTAGAAGLVLSKTFNDGKLGFGISFSVAAVVSSFTLGWEVAKGNTTSDKAVTQGILSAIEGAAGGALIGLKIGGVKGALIGGAIGLGVSIVADIVGFVAGKLFVTQEDIDNELSKRFGSIHLSDAEIELEVTRAKLNAGSIMIDGKSTDLYTAAGMVVDLSIDQNQAVSDINAGLLQVEQNIGKLKLGIDGSEQALRGSVDDWLKSVSDYISTSKNKMLVASAILGTSGSDADVKALANYADKENAISYLTAQLYDILGTASGSTPFSLTGHEFDVDFGLNFTMTDAEKAQAVSDIVNKIGEIMAEVVEIQHKARLLQIQLDAEDVGIDADSWKALYGRLLEENTQFMGDMNEVELAQLEKYLRAGYSEEEAYAAARQERTRTQFETTYGVLSEGLDMLVKNFSSDYTDASSYMLGLIPEFMSNWQDGMSVSQIVSNLAGQFKKGSAALEGAVSEMLETMEPSIASLDKLYTSYRVAGQGVPDTIRGVLNDVNMLKSLAGDSDAILYTIGQELTNSPTFYDLLTQTENAFAGVDYAAKNGIYANIGEVGVAAGGIVTVTKDGITTELGPATEILLQNFAALGIKLPDSLVDSAKKETDNAFSGENSYGNYLRKSLGLDLSDKFKAENFSPYGKTVLNGFKSGATPSSSEFNATAQQYQSYVKSALGQYMNEKEFVKYGQAVPAGTKTGMGNGSDLSSHASWILRNINPKTDEVINGMKNIGGNLVKGIIEGMDKESKSQTTSNGIKNVGNKILSLTKYHTEIGSPSKLFADQVGYWLTQGIVVGMDQPDALIDPLKTMYTNAKDWWDDNTMDIVGGDFEFTDESGKNHYMDIKDANNEQNTLLREQNALLRAILEKESSGSYYGTSGEAMLEAASHLNRRTGKTMIPVGV